MFFKHKKFISFLLTICTAFSLCSQTLTVFAVDGINYQSDFEISLNNTNTIDTNPVIDGIFVIENNGNSQIMMTYPSSTNNNESYIHMIVRGYDTHSELIRIRPFEGIPAMGLPAGTYLIEPVAQPNRYLTVQNDYSVVFKTVGSFPTANMLWNITRNSNGTYRITPYLYSNKALIGPMTSTP
ncbi:MAG: hypothetical protein IKU30_06585 [Clostridia bacterium]|nr:hypothetical protein [Clostridia bacterium]